MEDHIRLPHHKERKPNLLRNYVCCPPNYIDWQSTVRACLIPGTQFYKTIIVPEYKDKPAMHLADTYTPEERKTLPLPYRAAAVIFKYRNKVLLGSEISSKTGKFEWKHFGGKIERPDNEQPINTIRRELYEETDGQLDLIGDLVNGQYDSQAKMIVYTRECGDRFKKLVSHLKPSVVKLEYRWFTIEEVVKCPDVPIYVRSQVLDAFKK